MTLASSAMAEVMAIDDAVDIDLSGYSTTTTTTTSSTREYAQGCNWSDWSPVVDWDAIYGGRDEFQDLIESMMDDDGALNSSDCTGVQVESNSISSSSSYGAAAAVDEYEDSKGLRLVHLLMAAAEAVAGPSRSPDLARVILVRLKELVSTTGGSNMERLAAYFTDALHSLLEGAGGGHGHGPHQQQQHHQRDHEQHQTEVMAAFQLLQDMSPYVKFGHFTANQAILEAVVHERRIHIVDYDIMEGIQWASLMQALVSRKEGPPTPHLRITALSRSGGGKLRSLGTVQETGRRLVAFAASIGQPFSFHQCRLDSDESFRASGVKVVKGEALIFNCMLNLPHFTYRSPDSVASFLSGAKALNPSLITVVEEEEALGPTPTRTHKTVDAAFLARFMDSLHHYSALYDSLEAGFPMQSRARALVERVFLGPRIAGAVARIYRDQWSSWSWGEWLQSAVGYRGVGISYANQCQAKLLLGLFNDGYRVEEIANNRLVLGWKSRRLFSASVWTLSDL